MLNSPAEQSEPFDPGSPKLTSTDPSDERLQTDNDAPVPPRQSSRTMRNQPQWRYWNFVLQKNYILPSSLNIWLGLCICLHIISCVHMVFMGNTVWEHSTQTTMNLPNIHDSWHWWGYHPCQPYGGFLDGWVNQRIFALSTAAPLEKQNRHLPIELL